MDAAFIARVLVAALYLGSAVFALIVSQRTSLYGRALLLRLLALVALLWAGYWVLIALAGGHTGVISSRTYGFVARGLHMGTAVIFIVQAYVINYIIRER